MYFAAYILKISSIITAITIHTAMIATPAAMAYDLNFNGDAVTTLGDPSGLAMNWNKISGSGSFVFQKMLDSIGTDTSHALSFSLKEGGQLNFVTYSEPSLQQGISFVFSREGNFLKALIVKNGELNTAIDVSSELANVNATRVINLQIDVHNEEAPAHILIWDGLESKFSEDSALVNSEEISGGSPGNGLGFSRGFILRDATLLKAYATKNKFEH
jgi:hypothetical protein